MFAVEKQPADLLYPCARGWRVVKYVLAHSFARTNAAANWWYDTGKDFKARSEWSGNRYSARLLLGISWGANLGGLCQHITAFIFVALFVVIHVSVLAASFVAIVLMIGLLAAYNRAYSLWYRAYYRCTNCHESMTLPVYICEGCGTDHTRLWPSMYGVFHHNCSVCQTQLATTERGGRERLERKCPHCNHPLNAKIGQLTNVHVPVVGGPSAGKSNLIVMALHGLLQTCAADGRAEISFPNPADEREFVTNFGRLQGGRELPKTPNIVPQAYTLAIKRRRERVGKIVYHYDAAGEAFSKETDSLQQTYFQFVHGIIFVIDPFSLPALRGELHAAFDNVRTSLRPSGIGAMEAYERMLTVLEASVDPKRGKRFRHPLAVVVTKVDALGLEGQIGATAARDLLARDPALKTPAAAIDRLVRHFLDTYGLDNFVRDVDLQFESVQFFSASALGRMPNDADTRPFTPVRADEPLEWVLRQLGVLRALRH